ncbi:TPA: hypothetical protein JK846_003582 [Escherichia coli]|nr:hypothetical protein [Salmonella enterica subsp. enterica]EBL7042089.1 hypothetical protein [Salmonella enterica]EHQ9605816.1 hypothetical protein [Salmonella enterica]EJF7575666.1 hypothetical protein [Salmonella enterica subsp. enterica]HAV7961468.1 hypothetical protein [Escherichia coli]
MSQFLQSIHKRTRALGDKSAWILMLPSLLTLWAVDATLFQTIIEWLIVAPLVTGLAIILSRIVFPQVDLGLLVDEVILENKAAAIVVAGLMTFCGLLILALMLWARA